MTCCFSSHAKFFQAESQDVFFQYTVIVYTGFALINDRGKILKADIFPTYLYLSRADYPFIAQRNKGPVILIKRVKIAHSFLQSVSNQFHIIILSLPMQFCKWLSKNVSKSTSKNGEIGHFNL